MRNPIFSALALFTGLSFGYEDACHVQAFDLRSAYSDVDQTKDGFVLLTSLFLPQVKTHGHVPELFAALAQNLFNPSFDSVHVLVDGGDKALGLFQQTVEKVEDLLERRARKVSLLSEESEIQFEASDEAMGRSLDVALKRKREDFGDASKNFRSVDNRARLPMRKGDRLSLTEWSSSELILVDTFARCAEHALQGGLTRKSDEEVKMALSKLHPVAMPRIPFYSDFFRYAFDNLENRNVLLSNADVVFDETLKLVDSSALEGGTMGHVLAVQPPPQKASYSAYFGQECTNEPRCTIGRQDGWFLGGASWDAYIFRPPIAGDFDFESTNVPMFAVGAENIAGQALFNAGLNLSNPCFHVHAYHWHCQGGKMHSLKQNIGNIDIGTRPWEQNHFHNLLPCWDCPGIRNPEGADIHKNLCKKGTRHAISEVQRWNVKIGSRSRLAKPVDWVRLLFREPDSVHLCCKKEDGHCSGLLTSLHEATPWDWDRDKFSDTWVPEKRIAPLCIGKDDVDCIMTAARATAGDGNEIHGDGF